MIPSSQQGSLPSDPCAVDVKAPWDHLIGQASDGKDFELLCQWWLKNDPQYRSQLKNVWLWDQWDGRWGPDSGIDLVAQTHDDEFWAIQAKAYSPDNRVTKSSIDSWISESAREQFSFRLLICTTDLLSKNARQAMDGQEKPTGIVDRARLISSAIDWPQSLRALKPASYTKVGPRPHQKKAIDDVVAGFQDHDRGQLIMACGTGKTLTSLWIAEQLEAQRTLVLLPSLSLLRQTLLEWSAQTADSVAFKAVCSDQSVKPSDDEMVSSVMELGEPVATDPEEIAAFLRRGAKRVVFATYQSSPAIAEAQALKGVPSFDLVVCDEAHRTAGVGDGAFSVVLHADKIRASRRLFMTATPRVFTGKEKKDADGVELEVRSMDDQKVYGPQLHSLTFGAAVRDDLLCDYRVVIAAIDHPTYSELIQRAARVRGKDLSPTDARTLARELTLLQTMRKYALRRVLSFHSRVKGAKDFSAELIEVREWASEQDRPEGELWASYVSGEMPAGTRQVQLERLRNIRGGQSGVLSNARCLGEGVDLPAIDCVAFIDPRQSQTDIVQAVGRAMRKAADKELGTIVIPVVIDPSDDAEETLSSSEFKHVWDVVKALRTHDEVLAEELDAARRKLGGGGVVRDLGDKFIIDIPEALVGLDFAQALRVRLVEMTTWAWEYSFGVLESYVDQHGDSQVRRFHKENGFALGTWVHNQRVAYSKKTLDQTKSERLAALKGWSWDPNAYAWEKGFAALESYVERVGNALVPQTHKENDFALGTWVGWQRRNYSKGTLDQAKRERLESLKGWSWDPLDAAWEEGFAALGSYVDQHGSALVPKRHKENGFALGAWVITQRSAFRKRTLDKGRPERLESLEGWSWDPNADAWEKGFAALESYVERLGNARVAAAHKENDFALGTWVGWQRRNYSKGTLDQAKRERLESLKGWSWGRRKIQ